MLVNSSSPSDSPCPQNLSSVNPALLFPLCCLTTSPSSFIFIALNIIFFIILAPLCTYILYHGLQKWWRDHSTSSGAMLSHSDCFTYHMVAMELIGTSGCVATSWGIYKDQHDMIRMGIYLFSFTWYGQTCFHVLTCVKHYLAVVHPITYMSLRSERGIRIRNISVGCVWLLSFVWMSFVIEDMFAIFDLCLLVLALTAVSFCSLSVLCVLTHPGPGGQDRSREKVDQSRHRAFYTIVAILGALVLRFTGDVVWEVLSVLKTSRHCVILVSELLCSLPSTLVLPLLFLHRGGKLVCCQNNL